MSDVKVGDWVVNTGMSGNDLTLGGRYKVIGLGEDEVLVIDDAGDEHFLSELRYNLAVKYRNPPREEYRELCEAWLNGADLSVEIVGNWMSKDIFLSGHTYRINPDSILPQPDERKERIKKQLLNIDNDKLAQLLLDAGVEL